MNDIDILKLYFQGDELEKAIQKYNSGIPAAYIAGEWEFCGDRYVLNDGCLIPRQDTERVVEKILSLMKEGQVMADLCTGSGCIAISSLKRLKGVRCKAVDISPKAVEAAKENALINGVSDRLEIVRADVFENALGDEKYDLIVSNPPYIPSKAVDGLDIYVQKEPQIALDGGIDGMDFYNHIIENYKKNLTDEGCFVFEIGYDQQEKIKISAEQNGFDCVVTKDYSGNPRVACLTKTKG